MKLADGVEYVSGQTVWTPSGIPIKTPDKPLQDGRYTDSYPYYDLSICYSSHRSWLESEIRCEIVHLERRRKTLADLQDKFRTLYGEHPGG